jgi:hypothetical protein
LSPAQLAEVLRILQRTLSFYEREAGDIPAGAGTADGVGVGCVSPDELFRETEWKKRANAGPIGRMRSQFEAASKLPRSQQKKIAAVLEAFVNQHSDREARAKNDNLQLFTMTRIG